jgi:hypothetical protein
MRSPPMNTLIYLAWIGYSREVFLASSCAHQDVCAACSAAADAAWRYPCSSGLE